MRMWMVEPSTLCRQHLLGEHRELHMLAGWLVRGKYLGRLYTEKMVDPAQMRRRHQALVAEMKRRGYKHQSPLPPTNGSSHWYEPNPIDPELNAEELRNRCPECRQRQIDN